MATELYLLPVGDGKLTPEKAREWMRCELAGFHSLLCEGLGKQALAAGRAA